MQELKSSKRVPGKGFQMERVLQENEQAYKNMEAVAAMLTALSKKGFVYVVDVTYLDYGQDWLWTTISYNCGWCVVQLLNPREWQEIVLADTAEELGRIVDEIRRDKYFEDK